MFWRGLGSEGEQPVANWCVAYEYLAGKMNGTVGHWLIGWSLNRVERVSLVTDGKSQVSVMSAE